MSGDYEDEEKRCCLSLQEAKRNDKKASGIERAFKIIYSRRIVACSNHLLDYLNTELVSEILYLIRNILVFCMKYA